MKKFTLKNVLCMLVALMMLLPALSTLALATEPLAALPEITKQPTPENPTVEVNLPSGATYQWYRVEKEVVEITPDMVSQDKPHYYSAEEGWSENHTTFPYSYFDIYLIPGDILLLPLETENLNIYLIGADRVDFQKGEEWMEAHIPQAEMYTFYTTLENWVGKIYLDTDSFVPLTDETNKTLSSFEMQNSYVVEITFEDGTTCMSDIISMEYDIYAQPDAINRTIQVSFPDRASYQWFDVVMQLEDLTDEDVTLIDGAKYENGRFIGMISDFGITYFTVEGKAGETIMISHDAGADADDFAMFDGEGSAVEGEMFATGQTTFTFESDGTYTLLSNPTLSLPPIRASKFLGAEVTPIMGETTKTLGNFIPGKLYCVQATYEDGTMLISDYLRIDYMITEKPSTSNPTVTTNSDESVASYRWYLAKLKSDKKYEIAGKDISAPDIYSGMYGGGLWYSMEGYINIGADLLEGDTLVVRVPDGVEATVDFYYESEVGFESSDSNTFSYTSESGEYADFMVCTEGEALEGVEIYIQRAQEKILITDLDFFDDEKKTFSPFTYMNAYYVNGVWKQRGTLMTFYFESYKKNAYLTVNATDSASIYVYDNTQELLADENGKYELSAGKFYVTVGGANGCAELTLTLESDGVKYDVVPLNHFSSDGTYDYITADNGYYSEGKWHSDEDYTEIDIQLPLHPGDILTVIVSEEFNGVVSIDGPEDIIELTRVGNQYIFVADIFYDTDIELEGSTEAFTAQFFVQDGDLTLYENYGKEAPHEEGHYFLEVEFEDGTIDRAYNFYHNGSEHTYGSWITVQGATKDEAGVQERTCSVCHETETREIAPLKKDGLGTGAIVGIAAGSTVVLGAGGFSLVWFVIKKKSLADLLALFKK